MNIWDHCRISKRKFGGTETDFFAIHKFIDSSKLFYFNPRHRLLLHNLFGIEIVVMKFGDYIQTIDHKTVLVRDIAAEHCKEDLSGRVPSLNEWLNGFELSKEIKIPNFTDLELEAFIMMPFQRSNNLNALMITLSNFGVYLTTEILGYPKGKFLQDSIKEMIAIEDCLGQFQFTATWQFSPSKKELQWLSQTEQS